MPSSESQQDVAEHKRPQQATLGEGGEGDHGHGPKFVLDIEGQLVPWDEDTITTEQIAELGGWDISQGVILIDLRDNSEQTLQPGEVVQLRPGLGFSKRIKFKRG